MRVVTNGIMTLFVDAPHLEPRFTPFTVTCGIGSARSTMFALEIMAKWYRTTTVPSKKMTWHLMRTLEFRVMVWDL